MSAPREIALTSVRNLRPNKRNARTHSKKQIRQIADSIRRFGWTFPILVDENGIILAGEARYDAALQLGLREVPVIVISGLHDAEKRALALGDNKLAANAGWDRAVLAVELGELSNLLPECHLDVEITGFEPVEIDALMSELVDPEQDPADALPQSSKEPVSREGDLWLLGGHRLVCCDATDRADVGKPMSRKRALMGVDAAVRRWQSFTKRNAILAGTKTTFDEVAAARSKTRGRRR
jgi:ParB-like chromosome segregation protein Spo0J